MFGQLIIGPPGSGKSTYTHGMMQFLNAIGRKPAAINLDPANDRLPYDVAVDIRDFITLESIMETEKLGPNGGVMYALEQLELGVNDFIEQVRALGKQNYLLIDCPGQVELFTHHSALAQVFKRLEKELELRLVVVNLVDSFFLVSPATYISMLLLSLRTMLQFDLPHINVISKIDKLHMYGELPFKLDFYTEVQDLEQLYPLLDEEMGGKFTKLTEAIGEVVTDFGLVDFQVLSVEHKKSMINLLSVIDKASGYLFGSTEIGGDSVWVDATRQGGYMGGNIDIHERWIEHKIQLDEAEREENEKGIQSLNATEINTKMNDPQVNSTEMNDDDDDDEWRAEMAAFEAQTGIKAKKWDDQR